MTTPKCSNLTKVYFLLASHLAQYVCGVLRRGMGRALFHLVIQETTSIWGSTFHRASDSSAESFVLASWQAKGENKRGSHQLCSHSIGWSESHGSSQMQENWEMQFSCVPRRRKLIQVCAIELLNIHDTYLKLRSTFIVIVDLTELFPQA